MLWLVAAAALDTHLMNPQGNTHNTEAQGLAGFKKWLATLDKVHKQTRALGRRGQNKQSSRLSEFALMIQQAARGSAGGGAMRTGTRKGMSPQQPAPWCASWRGLLERKRATGYDAGRASQ